MEKHHDSCLSIYSDYVSGRLPKNREHELLDCAENLGEYLENREFRSTLFMIALGVPYVGVCLTETSREQWGVRDHASHCSVLLRHIEGARDVFPWLESPWIRFLRAFLLLESGLLGLAVRESLELFAEPGELGFLARRVAQSATRRQPTWPTAE